MADPYSGTALAAGALSNALGDIFQKLLESQQNIGQIQEREAKLGTAQRQEATQQVSFPMEAEALQTRTAAQKQAMGIEATEAPERLKQLQAAATISQAQASREADRLAENIRVAKADADQKEQALATAKLTAPSEVATIEANAKISRFKAEQAQYELNKYKSDFADRATAIKALALATTPEEQRDVFIKYGHVLSKDHPAVQFMIKDPAVAKNLADLEVNISQKARSEAMSTYQAFMGKPFTGMSGTPEQAQLFEWIYSVSRRRLYNEAMVHYGRMDVSPLPPVPEHIKKALEEKTSSGSYFNPLSYFRGAEHSKEWLAAALKSLQETGDLTQAYASGEAAEMAKKEGKISAPAVPSITKPSPAVAPPVQENPLALKALRDATVNKLYPGKSWQILSPEEKKTVADSLSK